MTEALKQFIEKIPAGQLHAYHPEDVLRAFVREVERETLECNGDTERAFDKVVRDFGLEDKT